MAYKKRTTSPVYEKNQNRLAGIIKFEPNFDFGNGLNEAAYRESMDLVDELTKKNNELLTDVDGVSTSLNLAQKALSKFGTRVLNAVGSKYNYDSVEYEKAGGVRSSDIKRGRKATKTTPTK